MKKLFVIGAVIFYGSLAVMAGNATKGAAGWFDRQKRIEKAQDRKRDLQDQLRREQFPAYDDGQGFQYLDRQKRIQDLEEQIKDEEQYIFEQRSILND